MSENSMGSAWGAPHAWVSALSGVAVVYVFTIAHNKLILDISFNMGPMLFAGALCGGLVAWSYQYRLAVHSTATWFIFTGLYAAEMIALGAVSLAVLRPKFSMAELMVADDAFDRLLPPSIPLMIGAIIVGTIIFWLNSDRKMSSLIPIVATQGLLVFFLGHQFAFLGLVESSSELLEVFAKFSVIVVALSLAFSLLVMWTTKLLERLRAFLIVP